MSDLTNTNAVLIVFAMPGCPACEEYLPKLTKQLEGFQAFGHPFVFHTPGRQPLLGEIPVLILDSTSEDPSVVEFANLHGVENLPTTILLTKRVGPQRAEGALSEIQIYQLLSSAIELNQAV